MIRYQIIIHNFVLYNARKSNGGLPIFQEFVTLIKVPYNPRAHPGPSSGFDSQSNHPSTTT